MTSDGEIYTKLPVQGYADAIDRVGFTAAPLLAGFAVTFAGFVLTGNVHMHWPNATLVVLIAAVLLLIACLQFSFSARSHYLPLAEFRERLELLPADAREGPKESYVNDLEEHRKLVRRAGVAYNGGITLLLFAIAAALVPAGSLCDVDALRWVAVGAAALGGIVEAVWFAKGEIEARTGS